MRPKVQSQVQVDWKSKQLATFVCGELFLVDGQLFRHRQSSRQTNKTQQRESRSRKWCEGLTISSVAAEDIERKNAISGGNDGAPVLMNNGRGIF